MLVLVAMLGLTKTQAAAAAFKGHEYNFVNTATKTTATIQWSKDDSVLGYKIYFNEGSFTDWDNYRFFTAGAGATSITFTGLKPGTLYSVNIQAETATNENQNVAHLKVVTLPDKVKNVEVSTLGGGSKLVVTFDQQTACDYEYRVTNLKGKVIPKLSGVKEAKYNLPGKIQIKNADAKKNAYIVSVRAKYKLAGKTVYGDWSKPVALLPKVSIKSATIENGKIIVAWDKVADATEYLVYASTSKNGTYTKVGTAKKSATSLTFTKYKGKALSSRKTYYVGIVAKTKLKKDVFKTPMAIKLVKPAK